MVARRCHACGMANDLLADLCSYLVPDPGERPLSQQLLTIPGSSCHSSVNIQTPGTVLQRTASSTLSDPMRDISSSS